MSEDYSLGGREHLVAKGLVEYYDSKDVEESEEWIAYFKTGRTGRIDTGEVRNCLEQLANRIILAAEASPLDEKRLFTPEQRNTIFENSGGKCVNCHIQIE